MAFFDTLLDLLAMADLIMLYKKKASRQSVRQFLVQRRASTPHFRRFTASLAYRRARGSPYDPSRPPRAQTRPLPPTKSNSRATGARKLGRSSVPGGRREVRQVFEDTYPLITGEQRVAPRTDWRRSSGGVLAGLGRGVLDSGRRWGSSLSPLAQERVYRRSPVGEAPYQTQL